jgi:cobyrinic acid a,c-diamide synthase
MFDELITHEFHYSDSTNLGTDYTATKVSNGKTYQCAFGGRHYYAGYPHVYYYANPHQVDSFLKQIIVNR